MPVIVGALGIIKKGAGKYMNKITNNLSLYEIQKMNIARLLFYPGEYEMKNITPTRQRNHEYIECI